MIYRYGFGAQSRWGLFIWNGERTGLKAKKEI